MGEGSTTAAIHSIIKNMPAKWTLSIAFEATLPNLQQHRVTVTLSYLAEKALPSLEWNTAYQAVESRERDRGWKHGRGA